jgi:hypothetical protein
MPTGASSLISLYTENTLRPFPLLFVVLIAIFSVVSFCFRRSEGTHKVNKRGPWKSFACQLPFLIALMFASILWAGRWHFWVYYLNDPEFFG